MSYQIIYNPFTQSLQYISSNSSVIWANITGIPISTPAEIDNAVIEADSIVTGNASDLITIGEIINGSKPFFSLLLINSVLYGTCGYNGNLGNGNIFSINSDGSDYKVLYNFGGLDGSLPIGTLVENSSTLYGVCNQGGENGTGCIFSININGIGYNNIYSFLVSNDDGSSPTAGLILVNSVLYGTCNTGGTTGNGTIFQINTDGTGYSTLYNFAGGTDGATPTTSLTLVGSVLYGTCDTGGTTGNGTIFQINTDGTGYSTLYNFAGGTDGATPTASLTLVGSVLYGTCLAGGLNGFGTIYSINIDGTDYTNLYSFGALPDGQTPYAALTLVGSVLYGTCLAGGLNGFGTIYSINIDGTDYTNLYSFGALPDGQTPYAALTLLDSVLYGVTSAGGSINAGTIYSINTDGTNEQILENFISIGSGTVDSGVSVSSIQFISDFVDNELVSNSDSGFGLQWTLGAVPILNTEHLYGFVGSYTTGTPVAGTTNVRLISGTDYTIAGGIITTTVSYQYLVADYRK